jgi:hypothetical protein
MIFSGKIKEERGKRKDNFCGIKKRCSEGVDGAAFCG